MNHKTQGVLALLTIGVLFGLSGVIGKYLSEFINAYQMVEYRFLVAFLFSLILLAVFRPKFSFTMKDIPTLALFSVTFPLSVILFYLSIYHTSVSLAVFSFYIATLISSFVVGYFAFKESLTKSKLLALLCIVIAVVCFTNPFGEFALGLGFLFGLISGVVQTIASAYQKKVSSSTNTVGLLFMQCATGVVVSAIAVLASGASLLPVLSPFAISATVLFGLSLFIIAYLFIIGFRYVALNTGSILASTELLFGPLFAFLLLGEGMTTLEIVGGVFLAFAVYLAHKSA